MFDLRKKKKKEKKYVLTVRPTCVIYKQAIIAWTIYAFENTIYRLKKTIYGLERIFYGLKKTIYGLKKDYLWLEVIPIE